MKVNPSDPYLKRVAAVAYRTLTMWRVVPPQLYAVAVSCTTFVLDLLSVFFALVIPFTFWLAPLYLWALERVARNRAKRAADAAELQKWMNLAEQIAKDKQ